MSRARQIHLSEAGLECITFTVLLNIYANWQCLPWEISAVFQELAAYSPSLFKQNKFLKPAEDLNEILFKGKKKSSQLLNLTFELNFNIKYSRLSFGEKKKNSCGTL